jgi:hypothetical protein
MDKVRSFGECAIGIALIAAVIALGYGACGRVVESAMIVAALN